MGQKLEQLLQRCTVKLSIPGKMGWGTGFFVAPGLILTCHHVVQDAGNGKVQVCWQNQEDFAEAVIERSLPEFDLALLQFSPPVADLPCVYLDESFQADDSLYTYGYPDDFPQGAPVTAKCEGMTGDEPPLIKFKAGQVRPGLSGSPLLNQRTGKVCGIVKFTRDRSFDLGGGAVPTSEIFTQFPQLMELQQAFHQRDDRWTKLLPHPPSQTRPSRQEYRNRQALLNKVKQFWVKGVLERSLHNQILIELGLEERPDAVSHPWNMVLQTPDEEPQPLPQGTKVIELFDEIGEGRTLLILGEPGSGKTTTLLELTRDFIARAEQDIDHLIPVVFNLSSWAVKKHKIEDWLVEELNSKYQVPKKIGQTLVKEDKLLLLLDGLDEVKAEYREQCITALNQFNQEYCPEIVVCSRIKDYEALSSRLNFQSAVYLRLLTLEQIHHYLNSLGSDLKGLRTLVEEDKALQELAYSPLMLNIMTLAYQGVAVEDLPKTDVVEERRKQLFDDYIERMSSYERIFSYQARSKNKQRYSKTKTIHWLSWLALRMVQESQTVFLIERMQRTWLDSKIQKKIHRFFNTIIICLPFGFFAVGIIPLCFFIFLTFTKEIKTVEALNFSWKNLQRHWIVFVLTGVVFGFLFGLMSSIIFESSTAGIASGLFSSLVIGIISGIFDSKIETKKKPNQGILNSAVNAGIVGLIVGVIAWLILQINKLLFGDGLFFYLIIENQLNSLSYVRILLWLMPVLFGLTAALIAGGQACIQHFTLRLILYWNGLIPWNYARFLNYATDRIFLQKVGGGYIFIHRMLMEHFANMKLNQE